MQDWHKKALDVEVASLLAHGLTQLTTKEFLQRYSDVGFRFDSSDSIKQYARYISGPRSGEVSPIIAMHPIVKATGRSWCHFENERAIVEAVKTLRNSIFAVSRDGYILEV